jgi:hypothetical protein
MPGIVMHAYNCKTQEAEAARHWWLTPIILATQEAEVRRIMVGSQPGQMVHKTLSEKTPITKKG